MLKLLRRTLVLGSAVFLLGSGPSAAAPSPELERAEREVERYEKDEALSPELRAALVATWRETAQDLRDESRWSTRAAEFETLRREAPDRVRQLRSELASPPAGAAEPDPDWDLAALEQAQARALAQKATAEQTVDELQAERRARTDRRLALPGEINRLQQQLDAVPAAAAAAAAAADENEPAALVEARLDRNGARARSLQAELLARQAELSSYDARSELLTLRQDLAVRRANEAAQRVELLGRRLDARRSAQAATAEAEAEAARRQLEAAPEVVRELALGNEALAAERRALVERTQQTARQAEAALSSADLVEQRHRSVSRKVEAARFTKPVALLMRRHQNELPDVGRHRARLRALGKDTSRLLARQLDVEDDRSQLTDLAAAVERALGDLEPVPSTEEDREAARDTIRALLEQRRLLLDDLYQEQGSNLTQLAELDAAERRLIDVTESYGDFIGEHLLWLRGSQWLGPRSFVDAGKGIGWLVSPSAWAELARQVGLHATERPSALILGLLALALLVLRRVALRKVEGIGIALGRSRRHRFRQTLEALGLTLLGAAAWPALCWWLADFLASAAPEARLGLPLAAGLERLAQLLLALFFLLDSHRPQGLAHAHFRWHAPVLDAVRRNAFLLGAITVPAFALEALLDAQDRPELGDGLGRLALVAGLLALAVFVHRTLDPSLRPLVHRQSLDRVVHRAAPWAAALLAVAAVVGYVFAARELGFLLLQTHALLFGLAVAHATALRWLVVERRRLRLEELRKQAAAEASGDELPEDAATETPANLESEELDLAAIDSQTRQLLRAAAVVAILTGAWALWADFLPAVKAADRVVLWEVSSPVTETAAVSDPGAAATELREVSEGAVTLTDLLLAILVAGLAVFAATNVPGLLEIAVLRRLELAPGSGYAVTTLTRYAITITGIVVTAGLVGLSWSKVQWLAAAVTVGLGFGLQEIFANFVSGLIILFERPIRVGDIVTVGGVEGIVTRIRTRATTISDWDRRELLVPNREFITGQLINWTLTDPITRIVIPVGIAYGSDTRLATEKLLEVAKSNPLILGDPRPSVVFRSFGASSLDFDLRVFIPRRDVWPQVVHELHSGIDQAFRAAGIEIAFPQRDIHVRSLPAELTRGRRPDESED